jgi:integrase
MLTNDKRKSAEVTAKNADDVLCRMNASTSRIHVSTGREGELFRDKLEALGLKRDRLCFHSFRHTVAGRLEAAAVSQTDAARVLGHTVAGMSYGVYSSGPGLKRLAAVIEAIEYEGPSLVRA